MEEVLAGEQSSPVVMLLPDHVALACTAGVSRCACLKGCSRAANGAGEVDQETWRYGKAAVQGGIGTSGTQPGKAMSGERRVLGEMVATMNDVQKMKAEGLLSM